MSCPQLPRSRPRSRKIWENELLLSKFIPHPDVTDEEIGKVAPVEIAFIFNASRTMGEVNDRAYDPPQFDQTLILGTAQSWRLSSLSHPFHIHVNPFQIVSVKDKSTGHEVSTGDYAIGECGYQRLMERHALRGGRPAGKRPANLRRRCYRVSHAVRAVHRSICVALPHPPPRRHRHDDQKVEVVLPGTAPYRPCATACDPTLPAGSH